MIDAAPACAADAAPARGAVAAGAPRTEPVELRVLLIEDSAMIRARLAEALAAIPRVKIAGQAETEPEALALMRATPWDVAVLDLQLKRGTGLGVLRSLAQDGRRPGTCVIVFTNFAFPQYRDRSLALGADYFFDKSLDLHRVRDVLGALANGMPPAAS